MSRALQSEPETTVHLLDNRFDAIEVGLRDLLTGIVKGCGLARASDQQL
jgi:hypothetical protein